MHIFTEVPTPSFPLRERCDTAAYDPLLLPRCGIILVMSR